MLSLAFSYSQHPSKGWEMEPLVQWMADILWDLYDKKDEKIPYHCPVTNSKQSFNYLQWTIFTVYTTEFLSIIKTTYDKLKKNKYNNLIQLASCHLAAIFLRNILTTEF